MTAFQIFTDKLCRAVVKHYGGACRAEINEIKKNNGVLCHGMTILREGSNISPTIYLEKLYREYEEGVSLGDILEKILRIYEAHKIEGALDLGFLLNFERVKDKIAYRLVNYGNNREMLSEIPHIRFLDMAVVFYCCMTHEKLGSIAVMVRNDLCRIWGIEKGELLALAGANTPRLLELSLRSMEQAIGALGGVPFTGQRESCMYVLTNGRGLFGAACLLYPGILRDFARAAGRSFYVLPSSVHEVLLVPEREGICGEELKRIVREINREQLEREEVLSDAAYYYDREKGKLEKI